MLNRDTAAEHITACNEFCQASPANLARMLRFVLSTIQQQLETTPDIVASFEELGSNSIYAFGSKHGGLDYIAEYAEGLFVLATSAPTEQDLMRIFLTVPGLGLVKAGFACQLFNGTVGCLDTHNIKLYDIPLKTLRFSKKTKQATQDKHINTYVDLCKAIGGPVELWAAWCDYVGQARPVNWQREGFSVSIFHTEILTNTYTHNVLWAMDRDTRADFEIEQEEEQ